MESVDQVLYRYEPSPAADLHLATWWAKLHTSGDLFQTFSSSLDNLSSFLAWFRPPHRLLYATDAEGIWLAAWFEPLLSGALMGLWADPRYRGSRQAVQVAGQVFEEAFATYPVLLGLIKQRRHLRAATKVGYEVLGAIPHLCNGDDAWLVVLTRAAFERSWWRTRRGAPPQPAARRLH
jgi:hypothetical protein